MQHTTFPLAGLRVLEFTHAVMGPSAGLLLADMGAEVIHIEPVDGDSTRQLKGFGSGYFTFYNRNKKSLALDIKSAEGKEIVQKLVKGSDILMENFGPGTMERLGYGYTEMAALNEGLIYCSLKGFMPGPYAQRHAMDEVVQMMGGLAYMTGRSGDPLRAGTSVIDITGGMFGVIGILLALYERQRTGKGKLVQASLYETTAFLMGQHLAYGAITRTPVPPMPERVSAWSIYRIFDTADGQQVFIGVISEKHWQRFCAAFERPDWLSDPRLATNAGRIDERGWFLPAVASHLAQFGKADIMCRCEEADIPFAPIARPEDLFEDPQLNEGGMLLSTRLPDGTQAKLPKTPLRLDNHTHDLHRHPPAIGQDNPQVLRQLGYSSEEITALAKAGVIAGPTEQ